MAVLFIEFLLIIGFFFFFVFCIIDEGTWEDGGDCVLVHMERGTFLFILFGWRHVWMLKFVHFGR